MNVLAFFKALIRTILYINKQMISKTIFIRSWGLILPILQIIRTRAESIQDGNGPENSFF